MGVWGCDTRDGLYPTRSRESSGSLCVKPRVQPAPHTVHARLEAQKYWNRALSTTNPAFSGLVFIITAFEEGEASTPLQRCELDGTKNT